MGFVAEMGSASEWNVLTSYYEKAQDKFSTSEATIFPWDYSGNTKVHIHTNVPK